MIFIRLFGKLTSFKITPGVAAHRHWLKLSSVAMVNEVFLYNAFIYKRSISTYITMEKNISTESK